VTVAAKMTRPSTNVSDNPTCQELTAAELIFLSPLPSFIHKPKERHMAELQGRAHGPGPRKCAKKTRVKWLLR
jgi:hypothetical protein